MNGRLSIAVLALVSLAGCTTISTEDYARSDAGFTAVSVKSGSMLDKQTVWIQGREQARRTADVVRAMVYGKTISAETAVQVALYNNRGLQASYADLGMASAEVWQQSLLENPVVSIGTLGIGSPELGAYRAIEAVVAANIVSLVTRNRRVAVAEAQFRQTQMEAVVDTLSLANETRRAWIDAVSAFERVYYLNQALKAADAASELAEKLGETGALNKMGQAREHVFYAELTGQKAEAVLAARNAKERLTRLMGLWGPDTGYFVPDRLPDLPGSVTAKRDIEREALLARADLQVARLQLEATALSYGLTEATRYLTDLEVIGGFETERELEDDRIETKTTPQIELEFAIPIFDSGKARLRKAEMAYMRDANRLAEKAVNVRSEARSAYTSYRAAHDIARHYSRNVLPLRTLIEEEALLNYNGMIGSPFELLADTRSRIGSVLLSVDAKRAFWLAEANMKAAIYGPGLTPDEGNGQDMTASAGSGGH